MGGWTWKKCHIKYVPPSLSYDWGKKKGIYSGAYPKSIFILWLLAKEGESALVVWKCGRVPVVAVFDLHPYFRLEQTVR